MLFPKSMPPPAPPARKQSAEEQARLLRFRQEIARLQGQSEVRQAIKQKRRVGHFTRVETKKRWAPLYEMLAGKSLQAIATLMHTDLMTCWRLLHGAYQPSKISLGLFMRACQALAIPARQLFEYLLWARAMRESDKEGEVA